MKSENVTFLEIKLFQTSIIVSATLLSSADAIIYNNTAMKQIHKLAWTLDATWVPLARPLVAFCLFTLRTQNTLSKHGCQMLQALIIHGLSLHWPTPPGISADVSSGWTPIGPSPNKAAFVNLHLCVALLETRGVNRCVNVVDNKTTTSTFGPLTNWLWMSFPLVQWVTDEWPSNLEPNQTKTYPKNPTLSVLMQTVFLSKSNKLCGLRSRGLSDLVLCLQAQLTASLPLWNPS